MKRKTRRQTSLSLTGTPNEKQQAFLRSTARYTAYGGARGGGKSWALRRKLILMALRYPGITCLVIRRSYPELRQNHLLPLQKELGSFASYKDSEKCFCFPGGSRIFLGYLSCDRDLLRYQGQEYDVIAIDEATHLSEYQFQALKACLRGSDDFPKRIYLTCNPGGIGHAWVKRLFLDRDFREGEQPEDYLFIPATVYDNAVLLRQCPDYLPALRSLPEPLRSAWLDGSWNVFEGQFFPECGEAHLVSEPLPDDLRHCRFFGGMDYGFDMLALLLFAVDESGSITVLRELARPNLTLSEAAAQAAALFRDYPVEYIAASPDLWNRRQDTGYSGDEIMSAVPGLPPLIRADNRRVEGWRAVRELLRQKTGDKPRLTFTRTCSELFRCMTVLTVDSRNPEDAASQPHSVTHLPEALRYGIMSRIGEQISPTVREADAYEAFFGRKQTGERSIYDF